MFSDLFGLVEQPLLKTDAPPGVESENYNTVKRMFHVRAISS